MQLELTKQNMRDRRRERACSRNLQKSVLVSLAKFGGNYKPRNPIS